MDLPQAEKDRMIEEQRKMEIIQNEFKEKLKEHFNEEKFKEDTKNGLEISPDDIEKYRKKEDKEEKPASDIGDYGNSDLNFKVHNEKGMFVAQGSNGHVLKCKNLDDLHRQMAKIFKINALKNHKDPQAFIHLKGDPESEEYKSASKSFATNFLKEGVAVGGDLPKDPKFWQKTKENFLAQEGHTKAEWEHLTRFVPKEYMKENDKEQAAPQQKPQQQMQEKLSPLMMQRMRAMRRL